MKRISKTFLDCPDLCVVDYCRAIIFDVEADSDCFYVDCHCPYTEEPAPKRPTREEVIATMPAEWLDNIKPEFREILLDLECDKRERSNIKMCTCTRRLTTQEFLDFPYHFKDCQLSQKGDLLLEKAVEKTDEQR